MDERMVDIFFNYNLLYTLVDTHYINFSDQCIVEYFQKSFGLI